jgi:hypothetical protein
MASSKETPRDLGMSFVETGGEPHYHVTRTRFEVAEDGSILCLCYFGRRGSREYKLQYTVSVGARELLAMAREALAVGSEGWNLAQWLDDGDATSGH